MDFAGVARSIRRGGPEKFEVSAAAVVGKVKPSALLDRTSGRVAQAARDSAAAVVDLLRSAGSRNGGTNVWQVLDDGLLAARAQLMRDAVDSQIFQGQLLLALRQEESLHCEEKEAGVGEPALALYWRLHESELLPFSKMLEANEALPGLALGHSGGVEGQRQCGEDTIVSGIRALASQCARAGDTDSPLGGAAVIVSDIAKHVFDLAYRTPSPDSEPIASRAARAMLDQLCCGQEMLGHSTISKVGTEARLQGCLSVLAAILQDGADDYTAAFITRQLRLLIENSSGQHAHVQGEEDSSFKADTAATVRDKSRLLVQILRHFPPAQCVEVLLSTCRRAVARAADTTGLHLHKPLLRWETFGPVVRAAATAHPEIATRIVSIGTEMAEAAVNFVPSGDGTASRTIECNQQQGVLILSAAFRLVAQADAGFQGARTGNGEGELYAQWFTNCFGPQGEGGPARGDWLAGIRPASPGRGQEDGASEANEAGSQLSGSEAVREVMEKQRATEILMEALCLSVPCDPAFVLEVHKDVLKLRLRKVFSVQVRDYLDLCTTRLADLKGQEENERCKKTETGHDRTQGAGESINGETGGRIDGNCGDHTTREVGFFLRQFKQTGEVPLALKTAILWHPKSWASFRKVLLAPPAERIAMPDGSGKVLPVGAVTRETIGRSENGLRVEISLKYRRLLVQKLAKESLLSAKDHESFRKSYVEFLQHQREQDKQSDSSERAEPASAVARQLLLLESRLGQQHQGSANLSEGNGIEERLGLLLQEYLPRALVVELCMEDEAKPPDRDWFARATQLLSQALEEWKRHVRGGEGAPPGEVAEAILNSVHCCVAAIGASLPLPRQSCQWNGDALSAAPSDVRGLPAPLDPSVAQAFRRFGEVVTIAARADYSIGDAICGRCTSLLANQNTPLDAKQVLSLAHILAALPPVFHPKVTSFWTGLVTKILRPMSTDYAVLAATAQVGALFLQSTLLLREHDWKTSTADIDDTDSGIDERDSSETRRHLGNKSVGFAPVGLLDFCWWMERRLSIAKQSTTSEQQSEPHLAFEKVRLLRLLRGVVQHRLIKLALRQACEARGSTTPPLKHLVALEMAVSNEEGFGGGSIKLSFLESVTLGHLVLSPTDDAESLPDGGFSTARESLVRPKGKSQVISAGEMWKECVTVLFEDPRLLDACRARVCRDASPSEPDEEGGVGSEQADPTWQFHCHSSRRGTEHRLPSDSEGAQGLLNSMLQVMGKLCSLEATAGSMCQNPLSPAGRGGTNNAVVSVRCSGRRKASLLLTDAVALLARLRVDGDDDALALVLIAEMTIPAIGATEGREKVMSSLRLMEECFCKARPLAYGAIVRLMRMALMWCGDRSETEPQGARHESCPVMRVLEELPMLAAEMVRVWPRLGRTLQPVIGSPASAGPYASGGWAFRLNILHSVGQKLGQGLAGGWVSSTSNMPTRGAVSSAAQPPTQKPGRIPLGPVNNSSTHAQKRGEVAAQKRGSSSNASGATEPCHDQLQDASAALPCTSAQVVVGTIRIAALNSHSDCSREVPTSKRTKTSARPGTTGDVKGIGTREGRNSSTASPPLVTDFHPPLRSTWVSQFLAPVYGPGDESPTVSSLGVLLSTLVTELGNRTFPSGECGREGADKVRTDDVCETISASLTVAILVLAPRLVARLAEPPCLLASSSTSSVAARLGSSLAVLDSLKLLLKEPSWHNEKPGVVTVVLTHYTAALLSMSKERAAVTLPNGRAWSDVAAFVHEHVARFSAQELRRTLPSALRLAAKEVDPLLNQYL